MSKTIIASDPADQEFLTQVAAQDDDDILTEAIGTVLWKIVAQNAVSGGRKLSITADVIDAGRGLSRGPIRSYVMTNGTIDMKGVEQCATQAGTKSAAGTLADDPDATEVSVQAFRDAWNQISDRIKRARLVAGFAC